MAFEVGKRVVAESESTDRRPRSGVVEEVVRGDPSPRYRIRWDDGHQSIYSWKYLRDHCPCAGCREDRVKPADPFRILKTNELVPLAPVAMEPAVTEW